MSLGVDVGPSRMHLPSLGVALAIMVSGTLYPLWMVDMTGRADHRLAVALFCAMSAGFVRGVGFAPRHAVWRALFSGWACAAGLLAAGLLVLTH